MRNFKELIQTPEFIPHQRLINDISKIINCPLKYTACAISDDPDYKRIKHRLSKVCLSTTPTWDIYYPSLRIGANVILFPQFVHITLYKKGIEGVKYDTIELYITQYTVAFDEDE